MAMAKTALTVPQETTNHLLFFTQFLLSEPNAEPSHAGPLTHDTARDALPALAAG